MGLTSGTKLGPYEIVSPLGAGGMGEVYRARDTRLDRAVAIKILPSHLSDNPEAKHRFDREAVMLGVDTAASMMRYSLTALDSNRPISLRLAQFAQFKAGRLSSMRVVVDTFDLVEQAIGRTINLPKIA